MQIYQHSDQLPLFMPIAPAPSYAEDDFIVGPHNNHAVGYLEAWAHALQNHECTFHPIAIITGAAFSGKTHLARIWAHHTNAYVHNANVSLEDILMQISTRAIVLEKDLLNISDADMFAILNAALNHKHGLLIVSQYHPEFWDVTLNDAKSRLRACPVLKLNAPSDEIIYAVLFKHFSERQILVDPEVIRFVTLRLPRNFSAITKLVCYADEYAFIHKRAITKSVISTILAEHFAFINEEHETQFGLFEDKI